MNLLNENNIVVVVPRTAQGLGMASMVSKKSSVYISDIRHLDHKDFMCIHKLGNSKSLFLFVNMHVSKKFEEFIVPHYRYCFILKPIDTMFENPLDIPNVEFIHTDIIPSAIAHNTIMTPYKYAVKNMVIDYYREKKSDYYEVGALFRDFIFDNPAFDFKAYEDKLRSLIEEKRVLVVGRS